MTKGTKTFRIIICILLSLTMVFSAFLDLVFILYISKEIMHKPCGIYVDGVAVTSSNEDDVLGDGTVYYDSTNNILVFNNATIESENMVVYSQNDLVIELIGENKLVCTNGESATGVYISDYSLGNNLALIGDGSLTIEIPSSKDAVGIYASELIVAVDLTFTTPDCENMVNGIVCSDSLMIVEKATVTVNNGASSNYSAAVRVRGNALMEEGTSLNVSVNPGSVGICKGLSVSGDLFLGKGTTLDVSIDDGATDLGECIRVSGLMEVGIDSTVTATAKNAYAIECFGTIEANSGAAISADSDKKAADLFCSGAVLNYGAEFDAEIDVIAEVRTMD